MRLCCLFLVLCCLNLACDRHSGSGQKQSSSGGATADSTAQAGQASKDWVVTVDRVALSPDAKWALFGYQPQPWDANKFKTWAKLWDVEREKPVCTLEGLTYTPHYLGFLEKGKTAVVGDRSGVVCFYEVPSGKLLRTLRVYGHGLGAVALSADGQFALMMGVNDEQSKTSTTTVWNLAAGKLVRHFENSDGCVALSPDHRLAVAGTNPPSGNGQMAIFDVSTGRVLKEMPAHDGWGGRTDFSSDCKRMLTVKRLKHKDGLTCQVVLLEIDTFKVLWSTELGKVGAVEFSLVNARFFPGETQVLANREPGTLHILDAATGKIQRSITIDFGTLDDGKFGQMPTGPTAYDILADGSLYLAVLGQNNGPPGSSTFRAGSNLTVRMWQLDKEATLVKQWRDLTTGN
jgi:WD40 repeat protein